MPPRGACLSAKVDSALDHAAAAAVDATGVRSARGSVSNENNILLDPDVLTKYPTQALLLTVLVGTRRKHCS